MPRTEEEEDCGGARARPTRRGAGCCLPVHRIGATLNDLPTEPVPGPRDPDLRRSCLEVSTAHFQEGFSSRRHRGTVYDLNDQALEKNRASEEAARPSGIRTTDFKPTPHVEFGERGKRCYEWTHRPTGYENPVQWEDPPGLGSRPTHPVSATGPVCLEHKRAFPERQLEETACPGVPRLSKAPFGSEWGGWARSGAPGRKPLVQPWDSLRPEQPPREGAGGEEAGYRFSDARKKPFPASTYQDTAPLTRWHLDARADIDPIMRKQVHLNTPREAQPSAAAGVLRLPPAGRRSGAPVEGSALLWYDRVRAEEQAVAQTAR